MTAVEEALDSMLGTLQRSMSQVSVGGVSHAPKGNCAACGRPIVGQIVLALDRPWHAEHFVCAQCGEPLAHRGFYERGAKAYCDVDYHKLFSPKCGYCSGPIKERCITAMDRQWHVEHFMCAQCGRELSDGAFHEKDGKAYCREDFFRLFGPRCHNCQQPITSDFVTALGAQWHPDCLICVDCNRRPEDGHFYAEQGHPLCARHFHARRGSVCHQCKNPINGKCVTAIGRRYHPEHFRCAECSAMLNRNTFKQFEDRPYCFRCIRKLTRPVQRTQVTIPDPV